MDGYSPLLSGLGGLTTVVITDLLYYPIEVFKTKVMGSSSRQDLTRIKTRFYAGYHLQLVQAPAVFVFFSTYQVHRRIFQPYLSPSLLNFTAAALSQVYTCLIRNPVEVLKQQIQVGRAATTSQALGAVLQYQGYKGLMTGLGPSLMRDMPFAGIQLFIYEHLKIKAKGVLPQQPYVYSGLGTVASVIAAGLTCPFDVLRTRLMSRNFDSDAKIIKQFVSSPSSWFVGLKIRCAILGLGGITWWYFYQKSIVFWRKWLVN